MQSIEECRRLLLDRVQRLNNGTGYLEETASTLTEHTLERFFDERMTQIGEAIEDTRLFVALKPIVALDHVYKASRGHRNVRDVFIPLLEMRRHGAELSLRFSPCHFFRNDECPHQVDFWNFYDDMLIETIDELQKVRSVSRLDVVKDARLGDIIVMLHELRTVFAMMFGQEDEADQSYLAALQLRTGAQQATPVQSKLLSIVAKKTPPPPTSVN